MLVGIGKEQGVGGGMGWAGVAEGGLGATGLKAGDVIGRTGLLLSCHLEPLEERETGEGVLAF